MKTHSANRASVALAGAGAQDEPSVWTPSSGDPPAEQTAALPGSLPAKVDATAVPEDPVASGEDSALVLRCRLLQMIVSNEQSRKSQTTTSRSPA